MSTRPFLTIIALIVVSACTIAPPAQIESAPEDRLTVPKADSFASSSADGLVPVVGPLIETSWGQGGDYKSLTPRRAGETTYPGCTTLASAQVLYYYQHQNRANQEVYYGLEHAPLTGADVVDDGSALYIDLPSQSHDFDDMALSLDGESPAQIEATATFIYHVAATLNAQFGGGAGSSATGRQIENAFRYQWGYNSISRRRMSIIGRDAFRYDADEWAQVIRDELDAGRPVLYMAQQLDADAGHAFVIDGYATNGLVHVNWGWGGYGNGWYDLETLEDPSGRRWIRDAMIFRGLEPVEGRAAELLDERGNGASTEEVELAWNGNFSLISHTSGTASGYGLTQDEALLHPTASQAPVVFLQWEIDARDGTRLEISADGMERASITYGPWSSRTEDRRYGDVTLPFVLDPANDGMSTADGEYYVIAIAFEQSPSTAVPVYAEPTTSAASVASSVIASSTIVDGFVWHGNGSLISYSSGTRTGYGLTVDEARIHPSDDHDPVVFFQWEIDGRDGRRLELQAGESSPSMATIRYGLWNDRSRDVTRTVSLPHTVDPSADGLSAGDGEYYVVMVSFDQSPSESTSVVATIVQ